MMSAMLRATESYSLCVVGLYIARCSVRLPAIEERRTSAELHCGLQERAVARKSFRANATVVCLPGTISVA